MINKNIFTHDETYYKIFETSKKKLDKLCEDNSSLKGRLGYINSVLSDFALTISIDRRRDDQGHLASYYKLQPLSSITEIIQYKINKGFELFDGEKIFKATDANIYSHLITSKPKEILVKTEDEK